MKLLVTRTNIVSEGKHGKLLVDHILADSVQSRVGLAVSRTAQGWAVFITVLTWFVVSKCEIMC